MNKLSYPAALLIGTNLGEREKHLNTALQFIAEKTGTVLKISSIYATAAWGIEEQPDFLNQAILISTDMAPNELLANILAIEQAMGRVREVKWGPRLIDIDILFYEELVIEDENLKIPHPYLPSRRFSLVPLAEITPNWTHPVLNKTVLQLLEDCPDKGEVRLHLKQ